MTETMSPHQAAHVFAQATQWQHSLTQRTEGITWMVWGTITAGILMTLGFVTMHDLPGWAVITAWAPWVLVGYALTFATWRTAALSRPNEMRTPGPLAYAIKSLTIVGFVLLLHFVVRPETLAGPMMLVGVGWVAAGILVRRLSVVGRRTATIAGVVVVAAAVLLETLSTEMLTTMLIGTAILGLVPVALGLFQTLQG